MRTKCNYAGKSTKLIVHLVGFLSLVRIEHYFLHWINYWEEQKIFPRKLTGRYDLTIPKMNLTLRIDICNGIHSNMA